ncbi:MAG: 4-diphosphocytidyl-2-C-methyl-D-erythritol kinase [Chthoniobacter sp.]|jgi:4-diphosphocytidyl-2-C-methyl-D-erythritol kinase|nr:4-diphosphocytidyl-2-C-methyl-D-erythritol kinase [Chthoniobacter sp.]
MQILAPAKINLTLLIKGRRDDGFHEIESLICPISLFDTLEITSGESSGIEFVCDDPTIPADETNLVVRAARLFCSSCGIDPHLHIELAKRIPHGAGLGGGSSDAAGTLFGLDRLFETDLTLDALSAMAAELGSDVPVFLHHSAAMVRGRGERVEPLSFPETLPLLLVKPPFGVPTPWAYQHWKDAQEVPGVRYAAQPFSWGSLQNDLERPVFEKYVFLALLKSWLLRQPETAGALLSGSGSTVFAVLREKAAGPALAERLLGEFGPDLWCCLAETVG